MICMRSSPDAFDVGDALIETSPVAGEALDEVNDPRR
jgi:hypothetical protein